MLTNAVRICEAKFGALFRYDGETSSSRGYARCAASVYRVPSAASGRFGQLPEHPIDRLLQTEELVHIADNAAGAVPADPAGKYGNARSLIAVPMRKENELIGAFVIYRN